MKQKIWVGLGLLLLAFPAGATERDGIVKQLSAYLAEVRLDKVRVKTVGSLVVVDGEVEIPSQLSVVETLVGGMQKAEPGIVFQSLVQVCPAAWQRLSERIEREIGSPEITARVVNQTLVLEGTAESDFEADRSVQIAKIYLGLTDTDRTIASKGMNQIVDLLRVRPASPVSSKKAPGKPSRR